jgi:hypothetical protein
MSDHSFGPAGIYDDNPEYRETPPGAQHEYTDAYVWVIVKFALWLAASAVIIHIGMYFVFGFAVAQREETVREFPLAGQEHRLPAAPRLQQFPAVEFYQFRQQEEQQLRTYGWIDREAGTVRLPIDEAMRLTIERGLPSRAADAPAPDTPAPDAAVNMMPADSSSGRTLERRRQ